MSSNRWNKKINTLIYKIGERSELLSWIHLKQSNNYNKYNVILTMITMLITFLSSFVSVIIGSLLSIYSDNCKILVPIKEGVTSVILQIATFTTGIHGFYNFSKRSRAHEEAYNSFSEIHHNIQKMLAIDENDREDAIEYLNHILEKYNKVNNLAPDLTKKMIDEYNKRLKKNDKESEINEAIINPSIISQDNIEKRHKLYENLGVDSYKDYQIQRYLNNF